MPKEITLANRQAHEFMQFVWILVAQHEDVVNSLGKEVNYFRFAYKDYYYNLYSNVGDYTIKTIPKHTIQEYNVVIPEPNILLDYVLDYTDAPEMLIEQRAYLSLLINIENMSDEEIEVYYRYVRTP